MATVSLNGRTPETVRREIEAERRELAAAVEQLREGLGEVADVSGKLRSRLGFFFAGGIGATMRFIARKGRER